MKKIMTLLVFSASMMQAMANLSTSAGWIWRNDDGDLVTATPIGDEISAITLDDTSKIIRLRIRLECYGLDTTHLKGLKYTTQKPISGIDGTGLDVFGTNGPVYDVKDGNNDAAFRFIESQWVDNGSRTSSIGLHYYPLSKTNRAEDYYPGMFFSSPDTSYIVPKGFFTELEYCIKPTKNVVPGTTYYFFPGGETTTDPPMPDMTDVADFPALTYVSKEQIKANLKTPSSKKINISQPSGDYALLSSLPEGPIQVSLINSQGHTVRTINVNSTDGNFAVSTANLPQGIYFIKIQNGKQTSSLKMIK